MEKIVIANMKMNLKLDEIKNYIDEIEKSVNTKRFVICPSSLYLPFFINKEFATGIQNISSSEEGAYTGEISPSQVESLGVEYSIVGHSERRQYYNEDDVIINQKIICGLKHNLKIILCIGETKDEKDNGLTDNKLKEQLVNDLVNISYEQLNNIIIAYEPIWSIGTGNVPTNEEIEKVINYIKSVVDNIYGSNTNIPVLYGGSVNEKNIDEINEISCLTGVLVGGASLIPSKINKIKEVILGK